MGLLKADVVVIGGGAAGSMCALTAAQLHIAPQDVIVASTGVIGQPLDLTPIRSGLPQLAAALGDHSDQAAEGIMTTDTHPKEIAVQFTAGGKTCTIGGIAKGYAAGRVRTILREAGVTSAIISLGGNVAAVGKKPDGSAWTVGLQDPDRPEAYFGTVSIEDACVVTSGAYQRYFEENGVCYHHILDPHTGCPAESGVKSVSVVAQDDTLADALSTALFVMGLDAGAELWNSSGLSFEAVFVTDDNTVWITPGLAGRYRSNRPYQILE